MKRFFYNIVVEIIKFLSGSVIVGKMYNDLNMRLYYERSQHLVFFFQSKIRYEETIQRRSREYIKAGDVIFDIGGNVGQYALLFSEAVGALGKVYSFEPDYKNYSFLQFNANINKCSNIICCNYGVGKGDSEQDFFRDTETGGRRGSFKKEFVGENFRGFQEKVTLKSFDTLIAQFGKPDFVKIDVEGFEDEVISGLTHELDGCVFLIEVRGQTKRKVFDYFNARGYECLWVDHQVQQIQNADQIPGFANLIFRKA